METYDDGNNHIWNIVKVYPSDCNKLPTFLATWMNRVGYLNVALFVRGVNNVWMTSIDGPFSSSEIRLDVKQIRETAKSRNI